jgi:SAM-dependent methyltransferase
MREPIFENKAPTAPLYTDLPYPADGVVRTVQARIIRSGVEQHAPQLLKRERIRIVDLGCGTGEHTLGIEKVFPSADIVGVDINPPSLALAEKLADRAGSSARFMQADICQNLPERLNMFAPGLFDLVSGIGVMHHLSDPRVGFRAARQLIGPEGLFYGFVYSSYGRREDMAIKSLLDELISNKFAWKDRSEVLKLLRLANVNSVSENIKRLKNRFAFGPPISVWELLHVIFRRNLLIHDSDSYSNPSEHFYRFSELRAQLLETGWSSVFLAKFGGLPTSPREHTNRTKTLALLESLPEDTLYDYFAFSYQANGFSFFCQP